MKTLKLALTATCLTLPAAAFAATSMDTNGDGVLTVDEVQAVYPDMTPETFSAMDVNADGALDDDEVVAGQDAGMMPPVEG